MDLHEEAERAPGITYTRKRGGVPQGHLKCNPVSPHQSHHHCPPWEAANYRPQKAGEGDHPVTRTLLLHPPQGGGMGAYTPWISKEEKTQEAMLELDRD